MATVLRAALAVVLLVGFYLVGLGLFAGLCWLSWWLLLASPGPAEAWFGVLVVATAVGVVVTAWGVLRVRPDPPAGATLTDQQAPELWSLVRELAESVGTRPPDEVRLWSAANAAVWEDARWLGVRAGRRFLYLGAPLLQVLTAAQVRAVLAHELGHYSRHHTRLGVVTYRGGQAIVSSIVQIGPGRVVGMVFVGYAVLYFRVSLLVMRRMELAADRTAVRVAGREAVMQALRGADRTSSAWEYFVASYVTWARSEAYLPSELLDWFGVLMANRRDKLGRPGARPPEPWSRWDPHPPIDDRVALVAAAPDSPVVPDLRPATVLVPDPDDCAAALRTPDFDRWVEQLAQEEAERDAQWLYRTSAEVLRHHARDHRCRIGCVLDLLANGRGDELQRALRAPDLAGVVEPVLVAVAATLVAAEGAQWRHRVGEQIALVGTSTLPIELRPQVTRACHDPAAVAELRTRLVELGVGSAVVTGQPGPWRAPLRLDASFPSEPASVTDLLLPEELFLLAYSPSGIRRLSSDVFDAGMAAAVLAELRLRGRLRLAPTEAGTVVVDDATPTGHRVLDAVLDRVGAQELPAYQWLQRLGSDVSDMLAVQLRSTNRIDHRRVREVTWRARNGIGRALKTGDLAGREVALGALLWGCELTGPVLGRTAVGSRFWLGRVAARDRLAVAIRTVIGLHMPMPGGGGSGSSG